MNPPEEAPTTELPEVVEDVPEEAYEEPAVVEELEKAEPPEPGPQTLKDRVLATLFLPAYAFRHHSAKWGWARPWLLVSAIGILVGAFTLMQVDLGAVLQEQFDRSLDQMEPAQREAMEQPATKEMVEKGIRLNAFLMKVGQVAGPPLLGLVGILFFGGVVFVLSRFIRGKDTPTDLMRCVSLVAWVYLVDVLFYGAKFVGVVFGTAMPRTSLEGFVDPVAHPVYAIALSRLDPVLLFFYGLLAVGMIHSLRIPRKRAIAACVGIYGAISFVAVGGIGAMTALQALGQRAGP